MKRWNPSRSRTTILGLVLGSVLTIASSANAQSSDEIRAKELQAKIKKDMAEIDALLLNAEKATPAAAQEKIQEIAKNLDELLKGVQTKQSQVMSDIEELVKLAKSKKSSKGSSGDQQSDSSDSQKKEGKSERPQEGDVDELKRQQEQEEAERKRREQEQQQANQDGKPQDGKPEESAGVQTKGDEKPEGEKGKFEREDVRGRWGVLPPKVAEQIQKLRNGAYPERYLSLIERYYRSQAEQESKKKR